MKNLKFVKIKGLKFSGLLGLNASISAIIRK